MLFLMSVLPCIRSCVAVLSPSRPFLFICRIKKLKKNRKKKWKIKKKKRKQGWFIRLVVPLEWIPRRCVSGKRFPSFCPIVSTFSLNLDMDAVEGGTGLQVSDLYGRENPGGWLRTSSFFFFFTSTVFYISWPSYWNLPSGESSVTEFSCFNMGSLGSWRLYRWGTMSGLWLPGSCCQSWSSGGSIIKKRVLEYWLRAALWAQNKKISIG